MFKIIKYNKDIDHKADLDVAIKQAYRKCRKFFAGDVSDLKIYFCYSRKEFNKFVKRATPEWLVGVSGSKEVVILSPSVFGVASNHPKSDFPSVLTHEIAHVFLNQLYGFSQPVWLREGIPGYVASQYKLRKIGRNIQPLGVLHDRESWDKTTNYPEAYHFTKYLIDILGKDRVLKLISTLGATESYSSFSAKLKKMAGMTSDRLFKNWLLEIEKKSK